MHILQGSSAATVLLLAAFSASVYHEVMASCTGAVTHYKNMATGEFTSPNYPNAYDSNSGCRWEVTVPSGVGNIIFNVSTVDIEYDGNCNTDYLSIANIYDLSDVWKKICGTTPIIVTGTTKGAYIQFISNSFGTNKGFVLSWYSADSVTTTGAATTTVASSGLPIAAILAIVGSVGGVVIVVGVFIARCSFKACSNTNSNPNSVEMAPATAPKPSRVSEYPSISAYNSKPSPAAKEWNPSLSLAPPPKGAAIAGKRNKPKPKAKAKIVKPHIMISYQWDVKPEILEFRKRLDKEGYRVWIDVEQMHKGNSTFESMASAVENSVVVIPVLTKKYQESVNCKKEIEYAEKKKRTLIPIRMEEKFEVEGWLSFLLGNSPSHTLCDEDTYDENLEQFFQAMKKSASSANRNNDEEEEDES